MPEAGKLAQQPAMTTLTFAVHWKEPVLVGPATATPGETRRLSDIDDQEIMRGHVPFFFFYRGVVRADDPASLIRCAVGEALVPYYPLAGRLREVEGRKLVVDCTGEGVLFVEADAEVRLAELEATGLRAPFPCMDQLLFGVEGSGGVLNCPCYIFSFVFALRLNHTICDAIGLAQFMSAVAEHARGLPVAMKVEPAWSRELLEARIPPKPVFPHREYDAEPIPPSPPPSEMVMRTFTFNPTDIATMKNGLPPHLRDTATSFEVLTAAIWRARTAALQLPPDEEIRLMFIVNIRSLPELALQASYYGNACVPSSVLSTAGALMSSSVADAVELVRAAKAAVTTEYVRSLLDHLALRGRPCVAMRNLFMVSDNRHAGYLCVDFGWGEPVYGGPANACFIGSFFVAVKNGSGEDAVAVLIALPQTAMDRFASEIQMLLKS